MCGLAKAAVSDAGVFSSFIAPEAFMNLRLGGILCGFVYQQSSGSGKRDSREGIGRFK
jgi:hypothetical protein